MRVALFDLDHTLIPFDSGGAWIRHLVQAGVLPAQAEARYLGFCHQYVLGTLDIHAMHRFSMGLLAPFEQADLLRWRDEFQRAMGERIPAASRALVQGHQRAGHLCAIVTATTRWVAEPFAQELGLGHLVCTEARPEGERPGTEIDGLPCFREHKPRRVDAWLASLGPGHPGSLREAADSWFYSDSASDLPLLLAVRNPVAVSPDERLRDHALQAGWPVLALGS